MRVTQKTLNDIERYAVHQCTDRTAKKHIFTLLNHAKELQSERMWKHKDRRPRAGRPKQNN